VHQEAGLSRSAAAENYLVLGGGDTLKTSTKINIERALVPANAKAVFDQIGQLLDGRIAQRHGACPEYWNG
jgi:hypothetical protein